MEIQPTSSAVSSSLQAIERNFRQLDQSAQRLIQAADAGKPADIARELVGQLNVKRDTQAQVKVLQTQDEMLGLILDLRS